MSCWDFDKRVWSKLAACPLVSDSSRSSLSDFALAQDPHVAICLVGGTEVRKEERRERGAFSTRVRVVQEHCSVRDEMEIQLFI